MHACATLPDHDDRDRPWGKSDRSILRSLFFFVGTSFDVHLGVWALQFLYKLQGAIYMEDLQMFMLPYHI
jgi:hypothetical protein